MSCLPLCCAVGSTRGLAALLALTVVAIAGHAFAGVEAIETPAGVEAIDTPRSERRFVLFHSGTAAPATVGASAAAKLAENKFEREILYSRWVRPNDIDFASAQPGDRVLVSINEGETFELVLSRVTNSPHGSTFWYGNFPGAAASSLFVLFSRPRNSTRKPTFFLARLQIPLQGRQIQIATAEELPGWAMLREIKPGTGTHLDNSQDTGGPAWQEHMEREVKRLKKEQAEKDATSPRDELGGER